MKSSTFFRRAWEDVAFRREQLEESRYFLKVEIGFLVLSAVGFVAHTLYAGLREGHWDAGLGWLLIMGITSASYAVVSTRIAALEAMEERACPDATANSGIASVLS